MNVKKNVLLQYTLSTFFVILAFSLLLGYFLAKRTEDIQVQKHMDLYPEIILQTLDSHPNVIEALASGDLSAATAEMPDIARRMMNFGSVYRLKIWGKDSTVLWSDDATIIGMQFQDNNEFLEAWGGQVIYNVDKLDKAEQASENAHARILEIYTPVRYQGNTIAVFEMYEGVDTLFADIQSGTRFIWWLVSGFGLTVYGTLFTIFYASHMRQLRLNNDLIKTQEVTILSLAAIAETRDKETGKHILRTRKYVEVLGETLKRHPRFKDALTPGKIELLIKSSPLHDIGKVGVPDHVLLKPGKLTPEEFEEIKQHTVYGRDAMGVAKTELGTNSFLKTAQEIAYSHHEKWDGSGYPLGLRGEEIPVSGRLMALADVYDALISKRVYKEAFTHEEAAEIIFKGKGQHFDPDVVEAFRENQFIFSAIARDLAD